MSQPRLFVSLDLPAGVLAALDGWRPEIAGARWVPTAKRHLTLRFLGATPEGRVPAITTQLDRLRAAAVPLATGGLLRLPSARRPRALAVEVAESPELWSLAARLDRLLLDVGIPRREQALLPHITLARFRPPDPAALRKALRGLAPPVGSGHAASVSLVESRSVEGEARYETRHRVGLGETADGAGG